jgi:protein phosphatase
MIVNIEAACDIGCVRRNNEDLVLVGADLFRDRGCSTQFVVEQPGGRLLVAVADGMGGAAAGEWASEFALLRLRDFLSEAPPDLDPQELQQLLAIWASETHAEMLRQGGSDASRSGAGTTVTGLLFNNGSVHRFHVGDSRLYRFREGAMERLTDDHTLRQSSGDLGVPRHILTNSLGGGDISWLDCAPLQGGMESFDRYLMCSDGLHDLVDDEAIAGVLKADRSLAVQTLVRLARNAGGKDNISVVVVDIGRLVSATQPLPGAY